jgi:hypothetical protein
MAPLASLGVWRVLGLRGQLVKADKAWCENLEAVGARVLGDLVPPINYVSAELRAQLAIERNTSCALTGSSGERPSARPTSAIGSFPS